MSTGVPAFDSTIQTTNVWLNGVAERLGGRDRDQGYHVLRAVLHALRDRLTVHEVLDLAAQLPMLVRGFYLEGRHPTAARARERRRGQFLDHIRETFRGAGALAADPEQMARAVFEVMAEHVTPGEVRDIKGILPKGVRELWPEPAAQV
jgi:uncharacterized protein (DUF2267 family)